MPLVHRYQLLGEKRRCPPGTPGGRCQEEDGGGHSPPRCRGRADAPAEYSQEISQAKHVHRDNQIIVVNAAMIKRVNKSDSLEQLMSGGKVVNPFTYLTGQYVCTSGLFGPDGDFYDCYLLLPRTSTPVRLVRTLHPKEKTVINSTSADVMTLAGLITVCWSITVKRNVCW